LDGYEFGDGAATLFAYGANADELFAVLEPVLRQSPICRGAVVTRRYGRAGDEAAAEDTVQY
jgi:hypothetical protein